MTSHFVNLTELPGQGVSEEQLERLTSRYIWALDYCRGKDVVELACGGGQGLQLLKREARSLMAGDISDEVLVPTRAANPGLDIRTFDAENIPGTDASLDVVILFEALYYIPHTDKFFAEAHRVLRPGGIVCAVGISRFASLFDGLLFGQLGDPTFAAIVAQDLRDGQHRNPSADTPEWFTTTFFHLPNELAEEVAEAGFTLGSLIGIEGPGKYIGAGWADAANREYIIAAARAVETEPSLLGVSAHLMAVGRRAE